MNTFLLILWAVIAVWILAGLVIGAATAGERKSFFQTTPTMNYEELQRLNTLIGTQNPVTVIECRPVPVHMTPSVVRERFERGGVIEMTPEGGMAVHQKDGTVLCVCPNG